MTKNPPLQKMTTKRFKDIIASYGADEACWPADERGAIKDLLSNSPDLNAELQDARALDQLLSLAQEPTDAEVSDAFMDRLLAVPADHKQPQTTGINAEQTASFGFVDLLMDIFQVQTTRALFPRVGGLAMAAVLGIMVGTTNFAQLNQGVQIVDASQIMISDPGLMRDLKEMN